MEKITWQAPEHTHREKDNNWYFAVSIVALGVVVSAVLLKNYFFAIFIVLAAFTLMMFASKRPRIVDCEINKRGIQFERYFFPYDSLKSFWVDEELHEPVLLLQSHKFFMPYLVLNLNDTDHQEVRNFLLNYLEEEEHDEPIFQKIFEYLGF